MTDIPLAAASLVALSPRSLQALRDRVGAEALQEAGYAAGESVFRTFSSWLPGVAGVNDPKKLAAPRLAEVLSRYFTALGWGTVEVTCRSRGDARCRCLVGAPDTLTTLYQHMVSTVLASRS